MTIECFTAHAEILLRTNSVRTQSTFVNQFRALFGTTLEETVKVLAHIFEKLPQT